MTIGSWYLERYVVYKLRNALGSVASNPFMVYLWGYLRNFSNLGSCCFFFGQDSVATEENHNISHVLGHWLRTTLNHILTSQVICFLVERPTRKRPCDRVSAKATQCSVQNTWLSAWYAPCSRRGKAASATVSASQSHLFLSGNSKLLTPVIPSGSRPRSTEVEPNAWKLLLDRKPSSEA